MGGGIHNFGRDATAFDEIQQPLIIFLMEWGLASAFDESDFLLSTSESGLGFGVWDLWFGVWSMGFMVWGLVFGV